MLAIRMQRTGRKGHAMFRVVVQDSHRAPTSGKFVALLGSYDPHAKTTTLVKDKAEMYLVNGAQPSDRVVSLFEREGVKLPDWIQKRAAKQGKIRNQAKLRKNQPKETPAPAEEPTVAENNSPAEAEIPAEATSEQANV
jgi:small subunit ribosomal protein S16